MNNVQNHKTAFSCSKSVSILVFLFFIFTFSAFAQQEQKASPSVEKTKVRDTASVVELDKVVVTATRVNMPLNKSTGAATIVTDKTVKTMPRAIAVDEAVGLVPGVRVDNQANGSRVHVSIRGQGILSERGLRGIKVLLDDVSLNDPTGFVSDLYDIDWATVDRVEVLRGPAAALYGCASNAGVFNIITQNGGDKPAGGMVSETNGSNGFWKLLGQVDGSKENYNYRASASHTQGYGFRDHQAFRGQIVTLKQRWTPSANVTISPLLNFSNYFNQNAEGLNLSQLDEPEQANPDAIPFNEYLKTTKFTGGLVAKTALCENHSLDLSGFVRSTNFKEANNRYVDYRTMLAPGGSLQYNWNLKGEKIANHVTFGTDIQAQTIDETKDQNLSDPDREEELGETEEDLVIGSAVLANQVMKQFGVGVFLQDRVDLGDKFSVMGNVRYDYIKNELTDNMQRPDDSLLSGEATFDKVTGRVGASFSLIEALNFYASWGLGFLPPCTEELSSNPVSYGGFNKNLKPSVSHGEEIGVRGTLFKRAYYELTGFTMFTENDFYRYRILPARPQETFYGNAGGSERYGIEVLTSITPIDPLELQVAYTYSHFKYTSPDSIKGNWLPNSPKHQLNAQIDYRFLKYFTIQASTQYQSLWYIYTDAHNADINQEGFTLFNARLGYDWKIRSLGGEISFTVKNIADKMWIAFTEPDLDDNGGPNNSYQPGPGREFFVNLKVKY